MKLGVLYKDDVIVNHRSLLKVLLNPILRYFGLCIGSHFDNDRFTGYEVFQCNPTKSIKYTMDTNDYDRIRKYRTII